MRITLLLFIGVCVSLLANGQSSFPYKLSLEPVIPEGFNGLQSYAWAKTGNKILLTGGRKDGLHRRQPFAAFNKNYNNTELIVLDIEKEKIWKSNVSNLPATIAEQLQSSNMEFFQDGNKLILTGGYGYSETRRDHITHPSLIVMNVKEIIDAIINKKDLLPYIIQVIDERMAVTGGRLNKLGNNYFLVGGQRFDGRYNPHGPDHGPGFSQQYTNQIRKFTLEEINDKIVIKNYNAITDSTLLHRRDYNLLPQYDEKGNKMLTIYSGVFQYDKDIPFTTLVDISENNHKEVTGFNQQFCHYHSASLPLYDSDKKTIYSIFFGGIAQNYTDTDEKIITDNNVPFVKHISVVERNGNLIKEYLLPEKLSGYFGAAAEFIPANEILFIDNGILLINKIKKGTILAGYIIGGIDSRAPNVFWSNEASPSRASPVIWKVFLSKK